MVRVPDGDHADSGAEVNADRIGDAVEQDWSDLPMIGGMPIPVPRGHPEYRAPKTPRYPHITVRLITGELHTNIADLTGHELNAYDIIGAVVTALKDSGVDRTTVSQFRDEALASDYDELLSTCSEWVTVS
jgi:hypothetical protein